MTAWNPTSLDHVPEHGIRIWRSQLKSTCVSYQRKSNSLARADGSLRSLLARLARIDVLVIDDWAMAPLSEPERRDFWEICEDRYQVRSTVLTSQLPVSRWHEQIAIRHWLMASSTA